MTYVRKKQRNQISVGVEVMYYQLGGLFYYYSMLCVH